MAKNDTEESVFSEIKAGLEDSIAFSRGERALETTYVPAPPPRVTPRKIKALRRQLNMSQAVFAATLNVSKRTVESWEQGLRAPSHASLRLLQIVGADPALVNRVLNT